MLSESQKQQLGYKKLPDGEYYMSFDDFCQNYDTLDICSLSPDVYGDELIEPQIGPNNPWKLTSYHGKWVTGVTAGGSGNGDMQAFWTNPQVFTLTSC